MSSAKNEPQYNQHREWIQENEKYFDPPVCNKMMHTDQLKLFFVGGPNVRRDYHLEEGEEFFFMRKGDMCLKVVEHGKFKDVPIKEGYVFLLPGRTLHSPQRQADTIGMVLERERIEGEEMDCLRYHIDGSENPKDTLYERWFYCDDLGSQLAPIIKKYFQSEEHKNNQPLDDGSSVNKNPPYIPDNRIQMMEPFCLDEWLQNNQGKLDNGEALDLFEGNFQSEIKVIGRGTHTFEANSHSQRFFWQIKGENEISESDTTTNTSKQTTIPKDSSFMSATNTRVQCKMADISSACIMIMMDPTRKNAYFENLH